MQGCALSMCCGLSRSMPCPDVHFPKAASSLCFRPPENNVSWNYVAFICVVHVGDGVVGLSGFGFREVAEGGLRVACRIVSLRGVTSSRFLVEVDRADARRHPEVLNEGRRPEFRFETSAPSSETRMGAMGPRRTLNLGFLLRTPAPVAPRFVQIRARSASSRKIEPAAPMFFQIRVLSSDFGAQFRSTLAPDFVRLLGTSPIDFLRAPPQLS